MRTETYTYTVTKEIYTYEELSSESKEKVKETYIESKQELGLFGEDCKLWIYETYGLDLKPYYSLTYAQGDGFCFEGDIDVTTFIEKNATLLASDFSSLELDNLKKWAIVEGLMIQLRQRGFYYHSGSIRFEYSNSLRDIQSMDEEDLNLFFGITCSSDELENLLEQFMDFIKQFIYDLCDKCEEQGYKYYYDATEQEVLDWIENNDYEFESDGQIYY